MRRRVDGITLGYDVEGNGDPVLYLHGFPLNRAMWRAQVKALRGLAKHVTIDFRGFGESDVPRGPYSLEMFAEDALTLARGLGVERATVIGLSMGGYVAFRLFQKAPAFVGALVLADTRAEPDTPEGKQRRLALAERVERERFAALQDFINGLTGETTKKKRPDVIREVHRIIGRPDPAALAHTLRAIADRPDSRPLLPQIRVPTLVIVGAEDTLTPPNSAKAMSEAIPNARLAILPQSGHLSNLETPEAFTEELRAFLRTVS